MMGVKAQSRIRVSVMARVTSAMCIINLILLVVMRMVTVEAFITYNPSVVSQLILPSEMTWQQRYGYSSRSKRPWYQIFKLRDSSLRWYDRRRCDDCFNTRLIAYQRAIYPVLQIAPSGATEESESFTVPDYFSGEEEEEDDDEMMAAEVMDVSPEDLTSASASTIELNDTPIPHRPTPEEQYWSVFGHEKGFLDGPLNPMHQRRELLEHLENHPNTVKNVMQKRVSSTTATIPDSLRKSRVSGGVVDGSTNEGSNSNAVAGLQPLIGEETSIEGHLQALFDANIVDSQGDHRQHAQSANVLSTQDNGTSSTTCSSITDLSLVAAKKKITQQHCDTVQSDLSIIYDERQKQYQVPSMSNSTTLLEDPRNDSMGSISGNPKNNSYETVTVAGVATTATPLRFNAIGESEVEFEYNTTEPSTTCIRGREIALHATGEHNSKSTMVEGIDVPPPPPNSMMWNSENELRRRPNPKLKPPQRLTESRIAINEMVKLYVKEGDSLFEDRTLCPRCSAPCREDELERNGGYCTACHSEDVGEEFCVNYGIQKKTSSPPHLSTSGRRMMNSTTVRGGSGRLPPVPVSLSTKKKLKTLSRPSSSDATPVPTRVSALEKKIEQLLNNSCNIMARLKHLESRLNITSSSVYMPNPEKGERLETSRSSNSSIPFPHLDHDCNNAVLKAVGNRGSSGNMFSSSSNRNSNRNSKALEEDRAGEVVLPSVRDEMVVNRGRKSTVAAIDMVERWRRSRAKIGKPQKPHKGQSQKILDKN